MNVEDGKTLRDVKRRVLRPLASRRLDRRELERSLHALDKRAAGDVRLNQLRRTISETNNEAASDNTDIHYNLNLSKILYDSRKISFDEFVFFVSSPIEELVSDRYHEGYYKRTFAQCEEAIAALGEKYGLAEGHYWLKDDEPPDYRALTAHWEYIFELTQVDALREFGQDEIAKLRKDDKLKFDEHRELGRRSVFHKDDVTYAIRDLISFHQNEAERAASARAFASAIFSTAAAIEGIMLSRCLASPKKAARLAANLPSRLRRRKSNEPTSWTFETLIEVCNAAGWLTPIETNVASYNVAVLTHELRQMRNLTHPGRHSVERPWFRPGEQEYNDAHAIYAVLADKLLRRVRLR